MPRRRASTCLPRLRLHRVHEHAAYALATKCLVHDEKLDVELPGERIADNPPPRSHEGGAEPIFESAAELTAEGKACFPEIMVPVTCAKAELDVQKALAQQVHAEVCEKYGVDSVEHLYGAMIEIPRAALTADEIAETCQFFSFGTNDLTQMI